MPGSPIRRARKSAEQQREDQMRVLGVNPADEQLPTARRTTPEPWSEALSDEAVALAEHGLSEAEIAAHWRVGLETIGGWMVEHAEFRASMSRASAQAMAWWERKARLAVGRDNNKFAAGAWAQVMRARFPTYADRLEVSGSVDVTSRLVIVDLRTPEQIAAAEPPPAIEGAALVIDTGQGGGS